MEAEIKQDPSWRQGDATPLTCGYPTDEVKHPEKEAEVMNRLVLSLLILALPAFGPGTEQDDMKDCPMHPQHSAQSHEATVEGRGNQIMGFPRAKTTHHFRMAADGGAIEVTANDPSDKVNKAAIRSHLSQIATMFGDGDFSTPMFIHDGVPPGVTTMKLMRSNIRYIYYELATGGRVRIKSHDPIAVAAIHDFLRFQITEHQTGDSLEVATR
jgi:hypothetical protein